MTYESEISTFYAFKKILITGGTGFMGKVLIWKLLHSCPELDTLYVLMRSKYGKSSTSRKEELLKSAVFDNFKKNNPKILEKVVLISGDVGEEGMGLSDKDRNMLIDDVSIIFHGAAILKMNSDLRTAVNVNTVGTVRMLDMAQQMKKLEAFVYISTAYSCCENIKIEEKIYPSKHNPYDIMNIVQWMKPELLETITPRLIYPLPNTYTYSKRLAESLLPNYQSTVPIIVARPSIVVASFKEPIPGWIDTFNGPMGFYVAGAKGVMRTSMLKMDAKSDMIPVDLVINSILILPWANPREKLLKQISVYNISKNAYENLTWHEIMLHFLNSFQRYPLDIILWYPNPYCGTNSTIIYTIKSIFMHYLPAYVIDFILFLAGQKPFMVRAHDKLRQGEKMLVYFTRQQWSFVHENVLQLEKRLSDTDKQIFTINMKDIGDFPKYIEDCLVAAKIYIFNEDMKRVNKAKITLNIMYALDKITLALRYYILWKILLFTYNILFSIFN